MQRAVSKRSAIRILFELPSGRPQGRTLGAGPAKRRSEGQGSLLCVWPGDHCKRKRCIVLVVRTPARRLEAGLSVQWASGSRPSRMPTRTARASSALALRTRLRTGLPYPVAACSARELFFRTYAECSARPAAHTAALRGRHWPSLKNKSPCGVACTK